jgi:hypothetical protein
LISRPFDVLHCTISGRAVWRKCAVNMGAKLGFPIRLEMAMKRGHFSIPPARFL